MHLNFPRRVEREMLDHLSVDDPRAQRSRRDLSRVQRAMATLHLIRRALDRGTADFAPCRIVELGAGDGSLMLRLARRQARRWPHVSVTLLDRLNLVSPATLHSLREVGWTPRVVVTDVFDWLAKREPEGWDVVIANLFVHHFSADQLERLFTEISLSARVFLCCEPRRSSMALAGSHLIGLLGAGPVTRQDAVSSVHAGFRAQELSSLWPDHPGWMLSEYPAGLFGHCFLAIRKTVTDATEL